MWIKLLIRYLMSCNECVIGKVWVNCGFCWVGDDLVVV